MSIEIALVEKLGEALVAEGLAATKVYPAPAPADAAYPFLAYQTVGEGDRFATLTGPSGLAHPRVQVDAYAESKRQAVQLIDRVRVVLDGFRGTVAGVRIGSCLVAQGARDLPADEYSPASRLVRRRSIDFSIIHEE